MSIRVERSELDPEDGRCQYYVSLKPYQSREDLDVQIRVPVEVAVSVSETGDLADLSFVVPKKYRNGQALSFISSGSQSKRADGSGEEGGGVVSYVSPRVFIAVPGLSGDAVLNAAANLELDAAGRIVGVHIH